MDLPPEKAAYARVPETADIETSSDDYARRFRGPAGEWMLAVQEKIALDMLADMPGASVLDVGGGHGQIAIPLCRQGYAVTVLGSDESCRRRIDEIVRDGRCRFLTGNVIALPFPDRAFDAAVSFRLLPHCAQWPSLIRELCRVARRCVVLDYPTTQGLNAVAPAFFGAKRRLEGNTRTWQSFRHAEVSSAFAVQRFDVTRRTGQFFLPMALHRMLHCRPASAAMEGLCRSAGLTRLWGSPVIVRADRREAAAAPAGHPEGAR